MTWPMLRCCFAWVVLDSVLLVLAECFGRGLDLLWPLPTIKQIEKAAHVIFMFSSTKLDDDRVPVARAVDNLQCFAL